MAPFVLSDSLRAEVLTCSRLFPEPVRTFWLFFSQPVGFSDKDLPSERADIHCIAHNDINMSNSDSSVLLIKRRFCLDSVTPRCHGDSRRVLSSSEDETSKNKTRKDKGKRSLI